MEFLVTSSEKQIELTINGQTFPLTEKQALALRAELYTAIGIQRHKELFYC
jgi:hypothetical protein